MTRVEDMVEVSIVGSKSWFEMNLRLGALKENQSRARACDVVVVVVGDRCTRPHVRKTTTHFHSVPYAKKCVRTDSDIRPDADGGQQGGVGWHSELSLLTPIRYKRTTVLPMKYNLSCNNHPSNTSKSELCSVFFNKKQQKNL